MDTDVVLPLVVCWLEASDAIKASCVCCEWRASLSTDQEGGNPLWKQVCLNTRPALAYAPEVPDYHHLALGLLRDVFPPPPTVSFTPTLRYEDLFAVVDLYRMHIIDGKKQKVIITSWTCSVGPDIHLSGNEDQVVLRGLNPYSGTFKKDGGLRLREIHCRWKGEREDWFQYLPHYFAWCDAHGCYDWYSPFCDKDIPPTVLQVRATLFRHDTMQSVCVFDEPSITFDGQELEPAHQWEDKDAWEEGFPLKLEGSHDRRVHFAQDTSGYCAQAMMQHRGYVSSMEVVAWLKLAPILPRAGSKDEPRWLADVHRTSRQNEPHKPRSSDLSALSSIPFFDFHVSSISLQFHVRNIDDGDDDDGFGFHAFGSLVDQMVALEGLCWQ